jgi:EAL domain-containing protein (putative c-di-GMP-specific phosphodiesterase class I)/NO-binding membrane sensor protein with MHYT domain
MSQIKISFILLSLIAGGFIALLSFRLVTLINVARDKEKNAILSLSTLMLGSSIWLLQLIHSLAFPMIPNSGYSLTLSLVTWIFATLMAFIYLFCGSHSFLPKRWLLLGCLLAGVCGLEVFHSNLMAMLIHPNLRFSTVAVVFIFPFSLVLMGSGVYFLYYFKFNAHLYRFRQKLIIAALVSFAIFINHWLLDCTVDLPKDADSLYPVNDNSLLIGFKFALGFICLFFMPFIIAIFYDKFKFNTFLWRNLTQATPENLYKNYSNNHLEDRNNLQDAKYRFDQAQLSEELLEIFSYDALMLEYQIKVDSKTRLPIGAEAFLRWAHPEKGLLTPADFMHLADKLDMRDDIDAWVLEETCRMLHRLKAAKIQLPISVNLSLQQLLQPRLFDYIHDLLQRFDLSQKSIIFEIPESLVFQHHPMLLSQLEKFNAAQLQIAIDDFGTQSSILSNLQSLPVSELKMGPALTTDIERNPKTRSVAQAIIQLAHGLGLKVVAENVETEGQRQALTELDCDAMQGFLISPPLTEHRFWALVKNLQCDLR